MKLDPPNEAIYELRWEVFLSSELLQIPLTEVGTCEWNNFAYRGSDRGWKRSGHPLLVPSIQFFQIPTYYYSKLNPFYSLMKC